MTVDNQEQVNELRRALRSTGAGEHELAMSWICSLGWLGIETKELSRQAAELGQGVAFAGSIEQKDRDTESRSF